MGQRRAAGGAQRRFDRRRRLRYRRVLFLLLLLLLLLLSLLLLLLLLPCQLAAQLDNLALHLGVLAALADALEVGLDAAVESEPLAPPARQVGRFLHDVTAELANPERRGKKGEDISAKGCAVLCVCVCVCVFVYVCMYVWK